MSFVRSQVNNYIRRMVEEAIPCGYLSHNDELIQPCGPGPKHDPECLHGQWADKIRDLMDAATGEMKKRIEELERENAELRTDNRRK